VNVNTTDERGTDYPFIKFPHNRSNSQTRIWKSSNFKNEHVARTRGRFRDAVCVAATPILQTVSPQRLAAAAMVAGIPSVSTALWSLVLLTCVAAPASSSGRLFGGQEHHEDRGGRSNDHERVGAQRDGISQKLLVDNVTTIDSWLNGAKKGFCGHTTAGSLRECRTSGRVSIHLTMQAARSLRSAVRVCLNACAKCERCNYITVNPEVRDCSWYATCDMDHLLTEYNGFLSAPVVVTLCITRVRISRRASESGPFHAYGEDGGHCRAIVVRAAQVAKDGIL